MIHANCFKVLKMLIERNTLVHIKNRMFHIQFFKKYGTNFFGSEMADKSSLNCPNSKMLLCQVANTLGQSCDIWG